MTTPIERPPKYFGPRDVAPMFSLLAWPGGRLALADRIGVGNTLLAFYPYDGTPSCTQEMCRFSANIESFEHLNTAVWGVSCNSLEQHRKFFEEFDLRVQLLSDDDRKVSQAYGAIREGGSMPNRITFLIDKLGIIRCRSEGMPEIDELLSFIYDLSHLPDEFRFIAENSDGVFSVLWNAITQQLTYRVAERGTPIIDAEDRPALAKPESWRRFWSLMARWEVWNWDATYTDEGVIGGMNWSLNFAHGGKRLESRGQNAGPRDLEYVRRAIGELIAGSTDF